MALHDGMASCAVRTQSQAAPQGTHRFVRKGRPVPGRTKPFLVQHVGYLGRMIPVGDQGAQALTELRVIA